jgi:hypothetical protein
MYRIIITIFISVFFFSCGKSQEINIQASTIITDSTATVGNYVEYKKTTEDIAQEKLRLQEFDSLCIALKESEKLSIPLRIKAINGIFKEEKLWYGDRDSLVATALSSLVMNSDIIKYNISEMFIGIEITHSEDNRLWAFSWSCQGANNGFCGVGFLCWRDESNKPQGYLTHLSDDNFGLTSFISINSKLLSKKNLYLLEQSIVSVAVVELIGSGINLNYPAFKTRNGYSSHLDVGWPDYYSEIDKEKQELKIGHRDGSKSIQSILKFNGKEFVTIFEQKK